MKKIKKISKPRKPKPEKPTLWENLQSIDNSIGFVYIITNKVTGEYYVGKKLFDKANKWRLYSGNGTYSQNTEHTYVIHSYYPSKSLLALAETIFIIQNIANPLCKNQMINMRCRFIPKHKELISNVLQRFIK